jgi:hypothetical protein
MWLLISMDYKFALVRDIRQTTTPTTYAQHRQTELQISEANAGAKPAEMHVSQPMDISVY